jgi:hypothetical protein
VPNVHFIFIYPYKNGNHNIADANGQATIPDLLQGASYIIKTVIAGFNPTY